VWRLFVLLRSPHFEIASVLVRLDHVARFIVNTAAVETTRSRNKNRARAATARAPIDVRY